MSKQKERMRRKMQQKRRSRWLMAAGFALVITAGLWIVVSNRQSQNGSARPIGRLTTNDFHALAFSATEPETVFFGHHNGMMVSRDGGKKWQPMTGFNGDAMALDAPPSAPQVIYAAGHGVFSKSTDGGRNWESPVTNLPGSDIHGFVADPDDADRVYANVVGFGIFGSLDGGTTWSALPANPNIMAMTMAIGGNSQTLYLPVAQDGLWRSQDGGQSWARVEQKPDEGAIAALYVRDNSRLYVTTLGNAAGLYVSEDQGGTWTSTGLNGFFVAIAVSPLDPDHVIVVNDKGEVFASRDGGLTWSGG
ncbi:MAG: hypothetical protein HYX49_09615 [Chloroflexi bacterium]|nr:hypothetical protein [Chloroflexota bacterium]